MNEVKVYKGHPDDGAKVDHIVTEDELFARELHGSLKFSKKKAESRVIDCAICGDSVVAYDNRVTCKKKACLEKHRRDVAERHKRARFGFYEM